MVRIIPENRPVIRPVISKQIFEIFNMLNNNGSVKKENGITIFTLKFKDEYPNLFGLNYSILQDMTISNKKIVHLPILIEQDEDNFYIVSCPIFKGCHSYGKTIDEALDNIKEVIDICIDEEKGNNDSISNRFVGFREMQVSIKSKAV